MMPPPAPPAQARHRLATLDKMADLLRAFTPERPAWRLHEIATPTLLLSGRYDEATPLIVEQIYERIPGAQWTIFEESSHMPHVEEPDLFLETVEAFLRSID